MKTKMVCFMILVLTGLSDTGYGWAHELPLSQPVGRVSGWPDGLADLANSPQRVAGYMVNFSFEIFYKGSTDQLNVFLQQHARLEHSALWVTLHEETERKGLLWNSKLCEEEYQSFNWKLTILPDGRFPQLFDDIPFDQKHIIAVDIWLDEGIDEEALSIPKNILRMPSVVEICSKIRAEKPDAAPNPMKDIVDGNTNLAFDLYTQLKNAEGNLFFSPYSISTALAMTYAGAKGKTAEQMANTLNFSNHPREFHQMYGAIINQFNEQGQKDDYQLSIANALWAQKKYSFLDSFVDLNKQYYKAGLENVDFINETEKSRLKINRWIEDKTNEKIKNLIPKGVLNAMTRLVLTNAIYFKGDWASQFDAEATGEQDFYVTSNKTIKAPLMYQEEKFKYSQTNSLQLLELPYKGEDLSMLVLLPKEKDGLAALENRLTTENLAKWQKKMYTKEVLVYLPKFKMTSQFGLSGTLAMMGMPDAFNRNADFSGMTGNKDLFISAVLHKAFVEVNEEGTEAAAATGAVMALTSVPTPPPVFRADHPFVFIIKDNNTGSILFIGRVVDPTIKSE